MPEEILLEFFSSNTTYLLLAALLIIVVYKAVKIVPQSEKHVVERFGRLHSVMGPGINMLIPFLDRIAHKISILERQLPTASQDAITKDNV
ncbi:Protein QmcA (possibly involved in integral membrane quality control), partial [hydrothermal vent metagenome]